MPFTFSEIIVLFFTYSVIGWIWETIYCSLKDHHYDYRGFLFGPYCPVYGFAVTTILIFTYHIQDNLFLLYIVGIIVATIFEYCASVFFTVCFSYEVMGLFPFMGKYTGESCSSNFFILGSRSSLFSKNYSTFYPKDN